MVRLKTKMHTRQGKPREIYETEFGPKNIKTLKYFQNLKHIKMFLSLRIFVLGVGYYFRPYFK